MQRLSSTWKQQKHVQSREASQSHAKLHPPAAQPTRRLGQHAVPFAASTSAAPITGPCNQPGANQKGAKVTEGNVIGQCSPGRNVRRSPRLKEKRRGPEDDASPAISTALLDGVDDRNHGSLFSSFFSCDLDEDVLKAMEEAEADYCHQKGVTVTNGDTDTLHQPLATAETNATSITGSLIAKSASDAYINVNNSRNQPESVNFAIQNLQDSEDLFTEVKPPKSKKFDKSANSVNDKNQFRQSLSMKSNLAQDEIKPVNPTKCSTNGKCAISSAILTDLNASRNVAGSVDSNQDATSVLSKPGRNFMNSFADENKENLPACGQVYCVDSQSPTESVPHIAEKILDFGQKSADHRDFVREISKRSDGHFKKGSEKVHANSDILNFKAAKSKLTVQQDSSAEKLTNVWEFEKSGCSEKQLQEETPQRNLKAALSPPTSTNTHRRPTTDPLLLSSWDLPEAVLAQYHSRNITQMFSWQAECLAVGTVLDGGNLVYSAPTSAGKTLVAELLILKRVLETKKKALFILPFVSVAREKMFYLQGMFQDAGVRVGGYMGHESPTGGFKTVDIAVCTIEKANSLVNRLLEENRVEDLGIIVVDEVHMVGDAHRGYLLELLLTKVRYVTKKMSNGLRPAQDGTSDNRPNPIQIIGMSATLPNLDQLASWLDAELYHTDYRPVPLTQTVKIGKSIYNSDLSKLRDFNPPHGGAVTGDEDQIVSLCLETLAIGCSVLIFCPTKNWCEKLADNTARAIAGLMAGATKHGGGKSLPFSLNRQALQDVTEQLKRIPVGLDPVLRRTVPHGVAYHHAGLGFDERDIIEGAFRQGALKILVATSTLSSGVNLPARRVIIRSIMFNRKVLDPLVYRQMSGRAGRKGVDTEGESILICKPNERDKAAKLMQAVLPPVQSCLKKAGQDLSNSMKRAILEVLASGAASTPEEVASYASCTLLAASMASSPAGQEKSEDSKNTTASAIDNCVKFLQDQEFIILQEVQVDGESRKVFRPTQLGSATLASALSPDEALLVFAELQRARKNFVLENDLHLLYQVTPIYDQGFQPDWYEFMCTWENLSSDKRRVAELVGIEERFLIRAARGALSTSTHNARIQHALAIHKRFYTTLILNDLVHEMPVVVVARKYGCARGQLQSLQQSAATFSGMVTVFCNKLGWTNMEILLAQYQSRLTFGVQRELCDLVRISLLNAFRARLLYNSSLASVAAIAAAKPTDIECVLRKAVPFQSSRKAIDEEQYEVDERKQTRCIWATGRKGLTEQQAAEMIVQEAKELLQADLGALGVTWKPDEVPRQQPSKSSNDEERPSTSKASPLRIQPPSMQEQNRQEQALESDRLDGTSRENREGHGHVLRPRDMNANVVQQSRPLQTNQQLSKPSYDEDATMNSKQKVENSTTVFDRTLRRSSTSGTKSQSVNPHFTHSVVVDQQEDGSSNSRVVAKTTRNRAVEKGMPTLLMTPVQGLKDCQHVVPSATKKSVGFIGAKTTSKSNKDTASKSNKDSIKCDLQVNSTKNCTKGSDISMLENSSTTDGKRNIAVYSQKQDTDGINKVPAVENSGVCTRSKVQGRMLTIQADVHIDASLKSIAAAQNTITKENIKASAEIISAAKQNHCRNSKKRFHQDIDIETIIANGSQFPKQLSTGVSGVSKNEIGANLDQTEKSCNNLKSKQAMSKVTPLGASRKNQTIAQETSPELFSVPVSPLDDGMGANLKHLGKGAAGLGMGAAGLGMGVAGLGTGAAGLGTGAAGLGTGAAGLGTGAAGLGTGAAGLGTGAAGLGTGAAGLGTGAAGLGTGAAGLGTGAAGLGRGAAGPGMGVASLGRSAADLERGAAGLGTPLINDQLPSKDSTPFSVTFSPLDTQMLRFLEQHDQFNNQENTTTSKEIVTAQDGPVLTPEVLNNEKHSPSEDANTSVLTLESQMSDEMFSPLNPEVLKLVDGYKEFESVQDGPVLEERNTVPSPHLQQSSPSYSPMSSQALLFNDSTTSELLSSQDPEMASKPAEDLNFTSSFPILDSQALNLIDGFHTLRNELAAKSASPALTSRKTQNSDKMPFSRTSTKSTRRGSVQQGRSSSRKKQKLVLTFCQSESPYSEFYQEDETTLNLGETLECSFVIDKSEMQIQKVTLRTPASVFSEHLQTNDRSLEQRKSSKKSQSSKNVDCDIDHNLETEPPIYSQLEADFALAAEWNDSFSFDEEEQIDASTPTKLKKDKNVQNDCTEERTATLKAAKNQSPVNGTSETSSTKTVKSDKLADKTTENSEEVSKRAGIHEPPSDKLSPGTLAMLDLFAGDGFSDDFFSFNKTAVVTRSSKKIEDKEIQKISRASKSVENLTDCGGATHSSGPNLQFKCNNPTKVKAPQKRRSSERILDNSENIPNKKPCQEQNCNKQTPLSINRNSSKTPDTRKSEGDCISPTPPKEKPNTPKFLKGTPRHSRGDKSVDLNTTRLLRPREKKSASHKQATKIHKASKGLDNSCRGVSQKKKKASQPESNCSSKKECLRSLQNAPVLDSPDLSQDFLNAAADESQLHLNGGSSFEIEPPTPVKKNSTSSKPSRISPRRSIIKDDTVTGIYDASPRVSSTQGVFTIIDVCSSKELFEMFLKEWRTKHRYSLSVACERYHPPVESGGIGGNIRKAAPRPPKSELINGFQVGDEAVIVTGLSVCWEDKDAYFISFQKEAINVDPDDSLAQPPLDPMVPVQKRLLAVKSNLEMDTGRAGNRTTEICRRAFDCKEHYKVLSRGCSISLGGCLQDPKVAHWLLDPGAKERNLHGMVTHYIPQEGHILEGISGGVGLGSLGLIAQDPGSGRLRAATESVLVLALMNHLEPELKEGGLYKAFTEVEMPCQRVLARMELTGFGFSQTECETQKALMEAKLAALEDQTYQMAGRGFTLTSPQDIAQVLYVELKLPPNGDPSLAPTCFAPLKTVGGGGARGRPRLPKHYSTSKDALEKLRPFHPLPGLVLEWRRITAALTKVVFPLMKEKKPEPKLGGERIYASCQTHTATGRVCLSDPNIQAIPRDFEIEMPSAIGESPPLGAPGVAIGPSYPTKGRAVRRVQPARGARMAQEGCEPGLSCAVSIRHAFCPFQGGVLLAVDYSQLELRILAHLSGDLKLSSILNDGGDVFKSIAAQWKRIDVGQVTTKQRQQAKQICYGMVYGIGAKSLGQQLDESEENAAVFMESFKRQYKGMRDYIKDTVNRCRTNGFVQTILHRRRYLPAITHTNPAARSQAERQAVNTTIQGSAADLVKRAMVSIDRRLVEEFPNTRVTYRHREDLEMGPMRRTLRRGIAPTPSGAFLVLQLHDELIYEVHREDVIQVAQLVKHEMEYAMELSVRLPVKLKVGPTWGNMKDLEL